MRSAIGQGEEFDPLTEAFDRGSSISRATMSISHEK